MRTEYTTTVPSFTLLGNLKSEKSMENQTAHINEKMVKLLPLDI